MKLYLIAFLGLLFSPSICFPYDVSELPFKLVKVFQNGKMDNDLLIARNPEQAGGASVGPNAMVLSNEGQTIFVNDPWQRKRKYFDPMLNFQYSLNLPNIIGFTPHLIEGDTAYGISYSQNDTIVFTIIDLAKKNLVVSFDTKFPYDKILAGTAMEIHKKNDLVELQLYSSTDSSSIFYNPQNGTFRKTDSISFSHDEYKEKVYGFVDPKAEAIPINEYARKNKLSISTTRPYFGEYKGYRVWLASMLQYRDPSEVFGLFGNTSDESLFVLIGKADRQGTPIKGFYLPAIKHYQYFQPLLSFNISGDAYLMYVDDATKRAHVIKFDMDDLIASLPAQ